MTTRKLLEAVEQGRYEEVEALAAGLDAAQRRAVVTGLKSLLAGLREEFWLDEYKGRLLAAYLAGAVCQTGAAAVAQWLMRSDFDLWLDAEDKVRIVGLLEPRGPDWLGEVAHRMADRNAARVEEEALVISAMVRSAGAAPPVTDGFVRGWMAQYPARLAFERLRDDPLMPALVPRIFEAEDAGAAVVMGDRWVETLTDLVRSGHLEREAVVGGCVAKLLRGDRRQANLRFFRRLCVSLELSVDESASYVADWSQMVREGSSTVAGDALEELRRLWEAGRLSSGQLVEVSRGVFFRTEKKLLRAQFTLLGKALRGASAGDAAVLLPAVGEAFGHPDADVQERALKLAEKHLPVLKGAEAGAVRAELAEAVALLGPSLRGRAASLLGVPEGAGGPAGGELVEAYQELLPSPPEPQPLGDIPGTPDEVARELGALFRRNSSPTAADHERVLDGWARQAYRDPDALAAALQPLLKRHAWLESGYYTKMFPMAVLAVAPVRPLTGREVAPLRAPRPGEAGRVTEFHVQYARRERIRELAVRLRDDPAPFLLSTPTWHTGVLEPGTLVERLREYARLGATPGPADLDQALLRVRPDPEWAAEAAVLGTPEAERVAAWLDSGGLPRPHSELTGLPGTGRAEGAWSGDVLSVVVERAPKLQYEFPSALSRLGGAHGAWREYFGEGGPGQWTDVLPHHREKTAAYLLDFARSAMTGDGEADATYLPALVGTEGEAGPALHLSLAYGMGALREPDRLAATDALTVLAAQRELDAGLLGRLLCRLVRSGPLKPNRLVESLGVAAGSGAYGTVWSVLAAALPGLLEAERDGGSEGGGREGGGEVSAARLGPLLGLAADCVERCGAYGVPEVAGLAEVAARKGSSQFVKQARRLREALAAGGGATG